MTYLELVQDVAELSGSVDRRSVTAVDGAVGRIALLATLTQAAWLEIQNESRSWRFLTVEYPEGAILIEGATRFAPTALNIGSDSGAPWAEWLEGNEDETVPLSNWPAEALDGEDAATLRNLEIEMSYTDYRRFRRRYLTGSARDEHSGQPVTFSINTADEMAVWPTPDRDYRLAGTYRREPQMLVADGDVPIIGAQFHDAIVWAATLLVHRQEEADPNVLFTTEMGLRKRMTPLRRRYQGQPRLQYRPVGSSRSTATRPLSPARIR